MQKANRPGAARPPNAFVGKSEEPNHKELTAVLGPAQALWNELIGHLTNEDGADSTEWKSYSAKAGWSLRLRCRKRNILYLVPFRCGFQAAIILGDRAVKAAHRNGLPPRVIEIIDAAPRYPEGRGVRIDVKGPKDIDVVKKLVAAKLE